MLPRPNKLSDIFESRSGLFYSRQWEHLQIQGMLQETSTMKNKINAEKKKLNMEGLCQNNSKYGGQIGLLGPDANLKLRPGHPRRGVHILRSISMAITDFLLYTFRPTIILPKIPSGINYKLRPKKGQVLLFSPEVIGICRSRGTWPTPS